MTAPIQEIRALLLQFERSALRDLYYRSSECTVFMARPDGAPNPLLAASASEAAPAAFATVEPHLTVTAPHLGLFEPCAIVGDAVEAGGIIAAIDVLGRKTEIAAPRGGRIVWLGAEGGDLVEFGTALLDIAAA
jgi:biotin carboxyl carrier protein